MDDYDRFVDSLKRDRALYERMMNALEDAKAYRAKLEEIEEIGMQRLIDDFRTEMRLTDTIHFSGLPIKKMMGIDAVGHRIGDYIQAAKIAGCELRLVQCK